MYYPIVNLHHKSDDYYDDGEGATGGEAPVVVVVVGAWRRQEGARWWQEGGGGNKHDDASYTHNTLKVGLYSFRNERGRHLARRHAISAIGHGVGHIDDIDDSSAFDGAAALIVHLLRRDRLILVESKGVMVGEVGAGGGDGLGFDLGVQLLELARMTLKGARVDGDLGGVLVLHESALRAV